MSNGLADRFKRSDESVIDMLKRIIEEITTDTAAKQWENKLVLTESLFISNKRSFPKIVVDQLFKRF